jgi:hypothetical protein
MKRLTACVFALSILASPALAQGSLLSSCGDIQLSYSPPTAEVTNGELELQSRFLCGLAVTALTNVQPVLGIAFSGGNPVLGTASTLGRRLGAIPRISVTARVNGAFAEGPDLLDGFQGQVDPGSNELPAMGTNSIPVASLQGDVVVGLFNGLSFGPAAGGLGAVDLLGSVSFIPSAEGAGLDEDVVNWGLGARIGILKQGLVMPGISVSGMYRNMSEVSFGTIADGDPAEFASDLRTLSLRANVSKGILLLDLAAGAGYDIYTSDVTLDWVLTCAAGDCGVTEVTVRPQAPVTGELQTAAWNVHGNVGLSLLVLNIVGELGYQKAAEVITAADLRDIGGRAPTSDDLAGGRLFGSIGVRLSF